MILAVVAGVTFVGIVFGLALAKAAGVADRESERVREEWYR